MKEPINFQILNELDETERMALTRRTETDLSGYTEPVRAIIDAVEHEGDAALARFAREFDGADVDSDSLVASETDFQHAFGEVDPEVHEALAFAAENVRRFHTEQKPGEMWWREIRPGAFAGERWRPIPSVACYVPRGKGSFPSVVIMTAVPAVVAGVPRIAIVTPPGPDGRVDAATLVAARLAGVQQVYKCGGAQAVAAVAHGTATVPRCGKIVGPGSPWVLAARRQLAEHIDTGTPAGPSEAIVLADATTDPRIAALDLIIESEHGSDSSAWLVTASRAVAEGVRDAVPGYWQQMGAKRKGFSADVLAGPQGGIVLANDMTDAINFTNTYAPEHLEICCKEPHRYLGDITDAGEILLGEHTPISLGNFVLGPNAVLPTGSHARNWSPLGVHEFMKATGIGHVTPSGYTGLASQAECLARYEGFDGHANALSATRRRLQQPSADSE